MNNFDHVFAGNEVSHLRDKKRDAFCLDAAAVNAELLPGRSCTNSNQCLSRYCEVHKFICSGFEEDTGCYSHADCEEGTFCKKLQYWPYATECKPLREENEECFEDYECAITDFCWYKNKLDRD